MGESNDDPFIVLPDTDEYEALSFLVRNRRERFTASEIAVHTNISELSASQAVTRLFKQDLIEHSRGNYYVEPSQADHLQQRLESVDAAERLHNTTPDDDIYATTDWEQQLNSR